MGKDNVDNEVIDRASDILKLHKAQEMLATALGLKIKEYCLTMILKYKRDGTQALYDKVLLERRV